MLRKENRFTEDPELDAQFKESEALVRAYRPIKAAEVLQGMIAATKNDFYKQEALFRLGNIYMDMGQFDPNAYTDAANAFDRLIKEYPDSNRLPLALQLTAQAKELSGQNAEAVSAYNAVYNSPVDTETKRAALEKMGDLYLSEEQWNKAIETYELYLANFKTDSNRIYGILGGLYLSKKQNDLAYSLLTDLPSSVLIENLEPQNILEIANIFAENGETDKALPLYAQLINDNLTQTPEALYRVAHIRKDNGDDDGYVRLLSDLSAAFPYTEYGLIALVEYAEINYADKSAREWRAELAPIYFGDDEYNLVPRARLVQIKALYNDNDTAALIPMIDGYAADYPESPDLPYLAAIKEDSLYTSAVQAQEQKNYPIALTYYQRLLDEFPESPKYNQVVQSIDDIHFDRAKQMFDDKMFRECRAAVETRITSPPAIQPRWTNLWEDTVYQYILTNIGVLAGKSIRYKCREYLTFAPKGAYVSQVKQILEEAFNYPFTQAFEAERDADVIDLYEENQEWLNSWFDQEFSNRSKVMVTSSLMRINMRDKATELFRSITPMITNEYAELGFRLCQSNIIFDVNNFAPDTFLLIAEEARSCDDTDYVLSFIKRYTNDPKTALKAQYSLLKSISDERKKEALLNDTYSALAENEAARFEGYEDVYMDVGIMNFKKNNFQGAVMPLKRYVDTVNDTDSEKKAEALYYLGKALAALNERDRAIEYYRQLTDTMPDSIFAGMAKGEMEDNDWRKNLNNR